MRRPDRDRPGLSRALPLPVVSAMAALAVVLAVTAPRYGYHRDELYFRMLEPALGYSDQPPLTPLLVRTAITLFGDNLVALRVIPLVFAVASVAVLTLLTREAGGGGFAQGLAAWGVAGASMTFAFGHVLLTASLDLVVWPAVLLFASRALLRDEGRWWLAAGAVAGASTFNKLLVAVLLVALMVGLVVCGPWKWLRSGWLWGGVGLMLLLALPNLFYQAAHGWPQLAMGAALGENNAEEVRLLVWPFLILMVGPVLAVFWVAALVGLFRRPAWRPIRLLAVTFAVILGFVFAAGAQFYYPFGVLVSLVAIGSVVVADWAVTRGARVALCVAVAANGVSSAIGSLPILPVDRFAASGLAAINPASAEQVGWQDHVRRIASVAQEAGADAIITANYGQAGAFHRFGVDLPPVSSGHNALWDAGPPPADASTVVLVGGLGMLAEERFASCEIAVVLDNGLGVENEEQGAPVRVCHEPVAPWSQMWPAFRHLD